MTKHHQSLRFRSAPASPPTEQPASLSTGCALALLLMWSVTSPQSNSIGGQCDFDSPPSHRQEFCHTDDPSPHIRFIHSMKIANSISHGGTPRKRKDDDDDVDEKKNAARKRRQAAADLTSSSPPRSGEEEESISISNKKKDDDSPRDTNMLSDVTSESDAHSVVNHPNCGPTTFQRGNSGSIQFVPLPSLQHRPYSTTTASAKSMTSTKRRVGEGGESALLSLPPLTNFNPQFSRYPKLFVGQLKKNAAVESLCAILSAVLPDVVPINIDAQINPITGQNRGCAWIHLANEADAEKVLDLHHRIFLDINDNGVVGMWIASNRSENVMSQLFHTAESRSNAVQHRRWCLPRQPLVVERGLHAPYATPTSTAMSSMKYANTNNDMLYGAAGALPPTYAQFFTVQEYHSVALISPSRFRWNPYGTKSYRNSIVM